MKRTNQGFTLIELMIVLAIVGILAAVAIPQYRQYVITTDLQSDVNSAVRTFQTDVSTWSAANGRMPTADEVASQLGYTEDRLAEIAATVETLDAIAVITPGSPPTGTGAIGLQLTVNYVGTSVDNTNLEYIGLLNNTTGSLQWGVASSETTGTPVNFLNKFKTVNGTQAALLTALGEKVGV